MTEQVAAARYLTILFLASIVASSAITVDYASNWFHGAAIIGSMERSVFLDWNNFSLVVPYNPNGTVRMVSAIALNNSANTDIRLLSLVQRYYLIGFSAADAIGEAGGAALNILQGRVGVLQTVVSVLYSTKAGLYQYANSTRNWDWITLVSITVGSGDLTVPLCFMGSLQNAPNATTTGPELGPSSCNIPTPTRMGGGG